MKLKLVAAIVAVAGIAGGAQAEPVSITSPTTGTTYFNRPGAVMAVHQQDVRACMLKAEEGIFGPPTLPGMVGIVPDLLADGRQNFLRRTNIENCMVIRGWRVIRVNGEAEVALSDLSREALTERLATLVGSADPVGQIARQWGNDAAAPDSKKGGMPGFTVGLSLSLKVTPIEGEFLERLSAPKPPPQLVNFREAFITKSTPLDQVASRPAGSAVIIVTLRGRRKSNDTRMSLGRSPIDRVAVASVADGPIAMLLLLGRGISRPASGTREETFVMVVPPGRWTLGGVGELVSFCMGAPAFEARAGEVIYAGAFDFDTPGLGPDMADAGIRAFLMAQAPEAAVAMRGASWINGETYTCAGAGMYALEFPAFPFREGYVPGGEPGPR